MILSESLSKVLRPLFEALPLHSAMDALVPASGASGEIVALVRAAVKTPAIAANPALQAGLWLYVDELDRSHDISQTMKGATGAYWHGIMHRREGDFSNSHYWFNRMGDHPAAGALQGYDPHTLVDEVAAARPANPPAIVQMQRDEWATLFAWCAHADTEERRMPAAAESARRE